jgi:hypothetical protein
VKTALTGKRFQYAEDIKKKVTAELNALPSEVFAVFIKLLNSSTNVFKSARLL